MFQVERHASSACGDILLWGPDTNALRTEAALRIGGGGGVGRSLSSVRRTFITGTTLETIWRKNENVFRISVSVHVRLGPHLRACGEADSRDWRAEESKAVHLWPSGRITDARRERPAPSAPCWRRMVLQPWSLPTTLLPLPTSVSDFIHQWMQLEPGCSNHLSMVHRVGLMPLAHEPLGDTSYRDSKHVG